MAKYPPMPDPMPRRRRPSIRGQRFRSWRVKGPVGEVIVTRVAERRPLTRTVNETVTETVTG